MSTASHPSKFFIYMPGLSVTMFNEINTIAIFVLGVIFLLLQKQEYNSKTCTFSASNERNNINRRCVRQGSNTEMGCIT